jgi:hypothetical protein
MQVNGYELREAMKRWNTLRNIAAAQHKDSIFVFEGDEALPLDKVVSNFIQADDAYSKLQEVQQWYNAQVPVNYKGLEGKVVTSTLAFAVKAVGGAGRIEKMWRDACAEKQDRYGYRQERERDPSKTYAKRSVTIAEAMKKADAASKYAMTLRQTIARANTSMLEVGAGCPITPAELEKLLS